APAGTPLLPQPVAVDRDVAIFAEGPRGVERPVGLLPLVTAAVEEDVPLPPRHLAEGLGERVSAAPGAPARDAVGATAIAAARRLLQKRLVLVPGEARPRLLVRLADDLLEAVSEQAIGGDDRARHVTYRGVAVMVSCGEEDGKVEV